MSLLPPIAWTIARRELRGGLSGFRVFLLCLILGVAAIAALATVRSAITDALADQGRALLGGDAQIEFTYRTARPEERKWMEDHATRLSEVLDFRSMARSGEDIALTQVKAVDAAWPMAGELEVEPPMPVADVFAPRDGLPGAAMDGILADRLGLALGDTFTVGDVTFRLSARIVREPDNTSGGFALAPRTLVRSETVRETPLLAPGSVFDAEYRLLLPEGADLPALETAAKTRFEGAGIRWQDSRRAAPGVERHVSRIGSFLILLGLAGLAVGGVGIAAATRAWIARKTGTIATLKALGATGREIRAAFLLQLALIGGLGIAGGLVLGSLLPLAAAPFVRGLLPVEIALTPSPRAMAEAATYGALISTIAVLLPLGRMAAVRPALLYRDTGPARRSLPGMATLGLLALLLLALIGAAVGFSGEPRLTLATLAGIAVALGLLWLVALALRWLARGLARARIVRGRPMLRAALAQIGGPGSDAGAVVLSLGLGLSVLAAVGQVEANLRNAISADLPRIAPAFFLVDIQPDQIDPLEARLTGLPAVERLQTAPMLRGVITQINGRDARSVAGDHWVLRGDRGVSYASTPPEGTRLVAGEWWPADYSGPPQASLAATEAAELGLGLGDRITVNILGRDIEATITSLRDVDYRRDGIGFFLILNAAALTGAPHTNIATVYAAPEAEAGVLRAIAGDWPNVTAIPVGEALARIGEALTLVARAIVLAAGVTLLTGAVVLIGAAASGERARAKEAALLKVLGATRGRILWSFALRALLTGGAAGLVALGFGLLAGWLVMDLVMEESYRPAIVPALAVVLGGALATLAASLAFAIRPLAARPAGILRAEE